MMYSNENMIKIDKDRQIILILQKILFRNETFVFRESLPTDGIVRRQLSL